jgi:hypothetical protein
VIPEGKNAEDAFTTFDNYNNSTVISDAKKETDKALSNLTQLTTTVKSLTDYGVKDKYNALNDAEITAKELQAAKILLNNYTLMPARAVLEAAEKRASDAEIKYNELIENLCKDSNKICSLLLLSIQLLSQGFVIVVIGLSSIINSLSKGK